MALPTDPKDKALAQKASTSSARAPWQEALDRHVSIPASRSTEAAEVIRGFAGSWAAMYALDDSIRSQDYAESPAAVQVKQNHLGQPGMAEINFRPYDFRTNRFGPKGPSLLGHPISFSVVGPTLKSPFLDFQWIVDEGANTLRLDSASIYSTAVAPLATSFTTIDDIFGISTIPNGGLYLVVAQTGERGELDGGTGGVGDGQWGVDLVVPPSGPRAPYQARTDTSKYEIFRVTGFVTSGPDRVGFQLDTNKLLSTYFQSGVAQTPIIRAITLMQPEATRLVAVPGSGDNGPGSEKVFAFVPPERSLNADFMPPAAVWTTGGFDPWSRFDATPFVGNGDSNHFNEGVRLPIPTPSFVGGGRVQAEFGEIPILAQMGLWYVRIIPGTHFDAINDIGRILRVIEVEVRGGAQLANSGTEPQLVEASTPNHLLLGYFEIVSAGDLGGGDGFYLIRRLPEVDPTTGVPNFGSSRLGQLAAATAGQSIRLVWTFHEPISTLWTSPTASIPNISASRLTNLIDPSWVRPALKRGIDFPALHGRPDRAIFDTSSSSNGALGSNANPGSLLDLGFRVVLFPAKVDQGTNTLLPDFDNPITSNDVVLDPEVNEPQWVEVDYSAGLVRFSHTPKEGSAVLRDADILTTTDNPRGEIVLYASCVPYSQEPGQLGANQRVTGRVANGSSDDFCLTNVVEATDAWSGRIGWPAEDGEIIQSGNLQAGSLAYIRLSTQVQPTQIPMTGFVEVVLGTRPVGPTPSPFIGFDGSRAATFGYNQVIYNDPLNANNTTLRGVFGGGQNVNSFIPSLMEPATVTLRRDVVTPNSPDGRAGTDFQFDTTYGFAARSNALHFQNATTRKEVDGSTTVVIRDPETTAHRRILGDVLSSELLDGGIFVASPTPGNILIEETTVLIDGVRTVIPATEMVFRQINPTHYLYVDGSDPLCPSYAFADSLPLPSEQDILLGRYEQAAGVISRVIRLFNTLSDLDERVNITVGDFDPHYSSAYRPHFKTLSEAITYVNELTDPTASGGVGDHPRMFRIQVVGPVYEDRDSLPIMIRANGIVVEGIHRNRAGGVAIPNSPTHIRWDANDRPLIDLNGYGDLVFRDLVFKYDGAAVAALDGSACVFTLNFANNPPPGVGHQPISEGLLIEGCRFDAAANGIAFVFLNASNVGWAQLKDAVIRNNRSYTKNAGVWLGSPQPDNVSVNVAYNVQVVNNTFECSRTPVLGGVRELVFLRGRENTVRDNHLTEAYGGVLVQGDRNVVASNYLSGTSQAAVYMRGLRNQATGNRLFGVHADGTINYLGGAPAGKVGILVADTVETVLYARVTENEITLAGVFNPVNHWAIVSSQNGNIFEGNICYGSGLFGQANKLSNNIFVHDAANPTLLVGPNSTIIGNTFYEGTFSGPAVIQGNIANGNVTISTNSTVDGNDFAGDVDLEDDNIVFTGNTAVRVKMNGVRVDITLTGNRFTGSMDGANFIRLSNSTIQGNVFDQPVDFGNSSDSVISDNRFLVAGGGGYAVTLLPGCDNVIFSGNNLTGGLLAGASGVGNGLNQAQIADNIATGDIIAYVDNGTLHGNSTFLGGIGVQGAGPRVVNNWAQTQQNVILIGGVGWGLAVLDTFGGAVVSGNKAGGGAGNGFAVQGTRAKIESNDLFKGGTFFVSTSIIRGNTASTSLFIGGADNVIQGNRAPAIISSTTVLGVPLRIPNSVIQGNTLTSDPSISIGDSSDNVVIDGNQCAGSIETALLDGAAYVNAAMPTITNNEVGGSIVCSATNGAGLSSSSDEPDIHNNRVAGNIVCAVESNVGVFSGCSQAMVNGNRVTGDIAVTSGYTVMGNRAANIRRAVGVAGADPDAAGIAIGNRIAGTIFGVAPTEQDSAGDTGHRKINTV